MCGIVGYVGMRSAQQVLLDGLEKLEYRGYDSAGVALTQRDGIRVVKSKGRLSTLRSSWKSWRCPRVAVASVIPAGRPTASPAT